MFIRYSVTLTCLRREPKMVVSVERVEKKWKLFRASNYLSLMQPCFELSRIHGLFPYKFNNKGTIVSSKYGYIFSTIITVLYMILLVVVLYQTDISGTLAYNSVPGLLQGHCYLLLGWWIAIVSYLLSGKRMRLLHDICSVSSKIPSTSFKKLSKIIHPKDIAGFLFLLAQSPNLYSTKSALIGSKVVDMYTTLVVYFMDSLYVDCVLILGECFKNINDKLLKLKLNMEKDEPHLLRRVYHEKHNPMILTEIRRIKTQHNDVSELVHNLNQTFSLQLVATVTLTFAEITFSLYFYLLQSSRPNQINLEKQIWYCYFITSVTYYALKLGTIVWSCEIAKDQALKTGVIVHEVLINTIDKEVKEELQLFSLQILHRDNSFTARGLSLDAPLLTSGRGIHVNHANYSKPFENYMKILLKIFEELHGKKRKIVGGITTYLLILIQFLVSSKSCGSIFDPTSPTTEIQNV